MILSQSMIRPERTSAVSPSLPSAQACLNRMVPSTAKCHLSSSPDRLDDAREAVGEVIAVASIEPHTVAIAAGQDAEAVIQPGPVGGSSADLGRHGSKERRDCSARTRRRTHSWQTASPQTYAAWCRSAGFRAATFTAFPRNGNVARALFCLARLLRDRDAHIGFGLLERSASGNL